jgi:hypothetical protein
MSPEEIELLKKSVSLAEDNNKILHSMRRSQRISQIMSFLYWAVIIGSAVGAYFLIQPYVDQLKDIYSGAGNVLNNFKQIGS